MLIDRVDHALARLRRRLMQIVGRDGDEMVDEGSVVIAQFGAVDANAGGSNPERFWTRDALQPLERKIAEPVVDAELSHLGRAERRLRELGDLRISVVFGLGMRLGVSSPGGSFSQSADWRSCTAEIETLSSESVAGTCCISNFVVTPDRAKFPTSV